MKHSLILAMVFCLLILPGFGRFRRPQMIPVDRLLRSAEKYLVANPESNEAKYILARIHYLAFARSSASVPAFIEADLDGKPAMAPNWMIDDKRLAELKDAELVAHATKALSGFRKLVKSDPKNGLYHLGLGCLIEQISDWKKRDKPPELSDSLKEVDYHQAWDAYLAAFRASFDKDSKLKSKPISGIRSLVSYEAGNAFIRLTSVERDAAPDLRAPIKEVTEGLAKLEAIPRSRAITPMIFSMKQVDRVEELLAQENIVDFDLRGYGPTERTTWIKPETALLVWDPEKQGRITSGQQLFGGYTFQIFRSTGYEALAALDDDGNGVLEAAELTGIRAWFDSNSDAVSSSREVRDLAELGIVGIKVVPTGQEGVHPTCDRGLLLRDGKTLPTWDWMATPVTE
ncbi:MAG: hypothetical protein AB8D78_11060 [Akkermansiaceae bacterium]